MTPERKEEIKRDYADMKEVGMYIPELLAALEEAQQQITMERERTDYWGNKEEEARWESAKWREDLVKVNKQLVEAQQTIARQREALQSIYEESEDKGARHCAAGALGIEWEGEETP